MGVDGQSLFYSHNPLDLSPDAIISTCQVGCTFRVGHAGFGRLIRSASSIWRPNLGSRCARRLAAFPLLKLRSQLLTALNLPPSTATAGAFVHRAESPAARIFL